MTRQPSALQRVFVKDGKLHPVWRAGLYVLAYVLVTLVVQVAVIAAYLAALVTLAGQPVEVAPATVGQLPLPLNLAWMVSGLAVLLLITYLFLRFLDRRPFASLGLATGDGWWGEIGFGILLGLMVMGGVFAVEWGGGWLAVEGFVWAARPLPAVAVTLVGYVITLLAGAATEEIVMRGYLFQNVEEWLGPVAALLITSFLFGLFHIFNPSANLVAVLNISLSGVVFGYAYLVTRRLWLPIAFHFAWNFFEGPVFGFPVSGLDMGGLLVTRVVPHGSTITGGTFGPEAGLTGVAATLVALALIWLWAERRGRRSVWGRR